MDQELAAYLERHFRENARLIESFSTETRQRLARLEDTLSQTRAAVEDLWDQISAVEFFKEFVVADGAAGEVAV